MNTLKKIYSAAVVCLLSFKKRKNLQLFLCIICILSLLIPGFSLTVTAVIGNGMLSNKSIEMNLNTEEADSKVTLNGMMPHNAVATVTDVTEDYADEGGLFDKTSVIAAYDITITHGGTEYQPGEKTPIYVEIAHPKISGGTETKLLHIKDDGTREEIEDFEIEDGKLSFYATGFSIYEIVEISGGSATDKAQTVEELTSERAQNSGFYLYYGSPENFFTANLNENDALEETTDISKAAIWFFEESGGFLKLYTYVDNQKKYLRNKSGNLVELTTNANAADLLDISEVNSSTPSFNIKLKNQKKWLQHSGSGSGIRYWTDNNNTTNSRIFIEYTIPVTDQSVVNQLDGKSYGIFHYAEGSTVGNAFMAEGDTHSLVKMVLTAGNKNRILYVDENNEIDQWTFEYNEEKGGFMLSTGGKYLSADGNDIVIVESPDDASVFTIDAGRQNTVRLRTGNHYLTYEPRTEQNGGGFFKFTTNPSNAFAWLNLLDRASLDDQEYITFSADRVSVSDVPDGTKVIVYVRIWNESELRYDMYAIDRDGSLYPCFASGGKIMWLGDASESLEWEFTEYLDPVTKQPNYYYELYNPYSEKYLAPQLTGHQVLSETPIGINLPGRRDGSFYSNAIAWDNTRYAYIGLRPNADKTALEPCAESVALPIYFATREELNLSDRLHEVPTLDNNQFGIKMKMVDIAKDSNHTNPSQGSSVTWDYLGGEYGLNNLRTGLLSSNLNENGYPTATKSNKDFGEVFANAIPVNHLFLQSVHESSGYFEFDSTQNFATLKREDENGNIVFNTKENGETDFTLYHELGTHTQSLNAYSLKHGQFFPYDTIKPGVYPPEGSHTQNLYSSLTSPRDGTMGELPETDPRKYEQLHLIQTQDPSGKANYYFGMEMEAAFVQTPSGLDAWGHDIIFEFTGDDDFWLYVDGQLVLDLGGVHSAQMGTINFRTGDVYFDKNGTSVHSKNMAHTTLRQIFYDNYKSKYPTATDEEVNEYLSEYFDGNIFKDYSTHTMKMFYMERGANASNLYMRFNIASVTPGHVVVSKSVSGEGTDALDSDFLEYPFQIYYTLPEGPNGEPGEEHLLGNNDEYVAVTYQNSNQPVNFVRKYRPPGFSEDQAYDNIYFINPSKNAEIAFPDKTITYRIVECAVNSTVYGNVTINGENVPDDRIEIRGDLKSYSSESGSAQVRPNISFDNHVNDNVIKDLLVTKKLLDEDNQEVTDDPATFNFRLSISSVKVSPDQIPLANMYSYLVLSPDKKICRFDPDTASFAETSVVYTRAHYKAIQDGQVPGVSTEDVTFKTSGFGSIAGIPAGYTICVPGLPVGSVFKVTEDPKTGYGLMGYERVMGSKTHEDGTVEPIASYMVDAGNPENIGTVIADENPQMEVHNRKGYGISAKKSWSDLSITTGHSEIYTAVYVDGTLLEGSVKQIKSPSTTANYFWTRLQPNLNGTERTSLAGYVVKEVTISNQNPTVLDDGTVTDSGTVKPISSGGRVNVVASRIDDVTPEGEDKDRAYDYIVTYGQKEISETSREDTITNTREGGIAIRLFRWNSDTPLPNGQFKLVDSSGNTVGNYYSDENGLVTILYDFEKNKTYTLTETAAPRGYVGLQKNLCFKVNNDGTVSLFYEDGTKWGTKGSVDLKWANGKLGDNGLSAYVDVYNKQFNFKVVKMDSEKTGIVLDNAHFALYKQTNTAIGGYEKNRDPLTGFEDMVTSNGELYICGGNSGRTLNPGSRGSVYFLTETQAPLNYTKLDEDIVFRISAIGVPSLISDSYNGQLVETEDSYIYTLSVPNEKEAPGYKLLTIRKTVNGNAGDPNRDFTFTLTVDSAEPTDGYEWMKNSVTQSTELHSGDTFTMKHDDEVIIAVPPDVDLTVTEQNQEYSASFTLNDGQPRRTNRMTFSITDDATLEVTNTLGMVVPTGVMNYIIIPTLSLIIIFSITAAVVLWKVKLCPHKKE
ncbi:DUF7601 domain-containing protein [Ruminococcus bovis]|uniref:PA14 domain-containing protein n=1 Tax=Ruminococcus bovis TaxID=2564099 RepID=A0A4P8XYP5_9FIRM|nr:SpaA isopeptide-forming pilin-related protein [Ruminococcus bovis]QCT07644.1 hypothetical protein E5Z56_09885 [Ruminococcus bovis]